MAKSSDGGLASPSDNESQAPGSAAGQEAAASGRSGAADAGGAARRPRSADGPQDASAAGRTVTERKTQFLIAARRPSQGMQTLGLQPLQFSMVEQALRNSPDIEIVDTVGPKNVVGALADGMGDAPTVLVARMTPQKAGMLHQQAQGQLIVERDQHLSMMDTSFQPPGMVTGTAPSSGPVLAAVVCVLGKDNAPLAEADVYLFGSMLPGSAVTDADGRATITLFGETVQSIRGLYIKPKADYWSYYQRNPDLSTDEANVVVVRPLADWPALADFPKQQAYGWGQRAMRLDQLPGSYRGQGIRIAIIDSGVATTHGDLNKVRLGTDIINKKTDPQTWNQDTLGHGSHCAGVIAGADNAYGIRGFAPDAEIHACKLFPGGQVSQLIDALEYCIEKQIDVVNLSLGGAEVSEALEQQILRAKRAGVACIVAAGNSAGAVQYPASSPNVLAVSAIGKLDEFPPDSYHSETLSPYVDANGYFAAKFSCYGPQVAVCGPGVAIVSSVPDNNFAVWDGTSMAAPHITGLAALVLAHHPDFQSSYKVRGADRVERLFQLIKLSARSIQTGDPSRTGFGLPDVLSAVGLQAMSGQSLPQAAGAAAVPQNAMPPQAGTAPQAQMAPMMAGPPSTARYGQADTAMALSPGAQFGAMGGYSDAAQWLQHAQQQAWLAPQAAWSQPGPALNAQMMNLAGQLDPAYAASLLAQQITAMQQNLPFGVSMQFVRNRW